ncbi:APC family permease [Erythrobacter alti]|uniref:APC family permease n=1 Tax=Erythrobacter alti TaxID=1896145 RepID=UPI0030F3F767
MQNAETAPKLGAVMSVCLVIGTMVGGGIFFLPSALAPLGWNVVIGWLICGAGAISLALSLRYLMDGTGKGAQHNIERVLGEIPGFLSIWAYWAAGPTSIAALCIAGGGIVASFGLIELGAYAGSIIAIALIWLLVAINLGGARSAGRFQVVTVAIKLIPLLLTAGVFMWVGLSAAPLKPIAPTPINLGNISDAVALTLFALLGFEVAVLTVNRIRNPARNVPLALIGGVVAVTGLYLVASAGLMSIYEWEAVAASSSPFSDALSANLGPIMGGLVAFCIFVSVTGCSNSLILIGAECTYSMAFRKEVPQVFLRANRFGAYHYGILIQGIAATVLVLSTMSRGLAGMFAFLALLTTGAILVLYIFGTLAAILENKRAKRWPVLGVASVFALFATYGAGLEPVLWVFVLLAIGLVVRWLCKRSDVGDTAAAPAV